jgi:hybrid cluster-associated redox disulfide protein
MITKDTSIIKLLQEYPKAAEIFRRFDMGCVGCMGMAMDTVESGAKMHNIPVEDLLKELNAAIQEKLD